MGLYVKIFDVLKERKVDEEVGQAVTKILTSSSKFSGSYVLTLQTHPAISKILMSRDEDKGLAVNLSFSFRTSSIILLISV